MRHGLWHSNRIGLGNGCADEECERVSHIVGIISGLKGLYGGYLMADTLINIIESLDERIEEKLALLMKVIIVCTTDEN